MSTPYDPMGTASGHGEACERAECSWVIGMSLHSRISRSRCVKASLAVGPPRIHGVLPNLCRKCSLGVLQSTWRRSLRLALAQARSLPCSANFPRFPARICVHSSHGAMAFRMVWAWWSWCRVWGWP